MNKIKVHKIGIVVRVDFPTAKIKVEAAKLHPTYRKAYKVSRSYLIHLPKKIQLQIGDKVSIVPCRPVSKLKRWQLAEIVEKSSALGEVIIEKKEQS